MGFVRAGVQAFTFIDPTDQQGYLRLDVTPVLASNGQVSGWPQIAFVGADWRFVSYIGKLTVTGEGEVTLESGSQTWNQVGLLSLTHIENFRGVVDQTFRVKFKCVLRSKDKTLYLELKDEAGFVVWSTVSEASPDGFISGLNGLIYVSGASVPTT